MQANTDSKTGEGNAPRECPKCGDLRETPWHDQDCDYRPAPRYRYELTDGTEILGVAYFNADELFAAAKHARQVSDGNLFYRQTEGAPQ